MKNNQPNKSEAKKFLSSKTFKIGFPIYVLILLCTYLMHKNGYYTDMTTRVVMFSIQLIGAFFFPLAYRKESKKSFNYEKSSQPSVTIN